jgi:hypothetical protein
LKFIVLEQENANTGSRTPTIEEECQEKTLTNAFGLTRLMETNDSMMITNSNTNIILNQPKSNRNDNDEAIFDDDPMEEDSHQHTSVAIS